MNARLTGAVLGIVLLLAASAQAAAQGSPDQTSPSPLSVTPLKVEFGNQAVGTNSVPQTVTLTNSGTADVEIGNILTAGIDFSQTNTCAAVLAPGASCSVKITFTPAIPGLRIGTLNLFDSAPGNPQRVTLTGNGQ